MKSIKLNDTLSVIILFQHNPVQRLTPQGLEATDMVTCGIYEARGLKLIASGESLRDAEDKQDEVTGQELALRRALKYGAVFNKAARNVIFQAFLSQDGNEELARLISQYETDGLLHVGRLDDNVDTQESCSECKETLAQINKLKRAA